MIDRIRFRSGYTGSDGKYREDNAEFTLGTGPCGKDVTVLNSYVNGDFLVISQVTACGEVKHFYYPSNQLRGRVEVTETAPN